MFFSLPSYAQYSVGDYLSVASGSWTSSSTWQIVTSISPLTLGANGVPVSTNNVFVRTGNVVTLPSGVNSCLNLTVETGAKLWTSNSATNIYLDVFGTSLVCDGQIGDGGTFDGISFNIEGTSCTITGSGLFDASRLRKNLASNTTTNLIISRNINLSFASGSTTQIYNNCSNTIFNVTISSGATLNLMPSGPNTGHASIDGLDGAGTGAFLIEAGGTFTVNGTFIISGRLYLTTNNTNTTYSCNWIIGNGGLVQASEIVATNSGTAGHSLVINSGGKLDITGTAAFSSIGPTNNSYTFNSGSTVEYSAAGAQTIRINAATEFGAASTTYGNLNLSGSGIKSTSVAGILTIKNNLTISGSAVLSTFAAAAQIQVGGDWTNYSETGFVEQTTTVSFNSSPPVPQSITCSGGEVFYNLRQSSATNILKFNSPVDVINALQLTAANGLVDLNSNALTVRNSAAVGIAGGGANKYIISEKTDNSSKIKWKIGSTAGAHVFPFGKPVASGVYTYLPFTYNLTSGSADTVTVSTYPTANTNVPWPITPRTVTNLNTYSVLAPNDSAATIDRFWEIDVSNSVVPTSTLIFTYANSELPTNPLYNVTTDMRAQWYNDNSAVNKWQPAIPGQTTATAALTSSVTVPLNTYYGVWAIASQLSPLPIELLFFNAQLKDNVVDVVWTTASEINNDYFTIEKSKDAETFFEIGRVKGEGNSSAIKNYSFEDEHPLKGISYYRLKQTDFDGHFSYSNIVAVINNFGGDSYVTYPNPVHDVLYITSVDKGYKENATLQILNTQGLLIRNFSLFSKRDFIDKINISDLLSGIYFGRISTTYDQQMFKIVKE